MTSVEQSRMIRELRDVVSRMTRAEQEMYDMYRKRDNDDEDLDLLSRRHLAELHQKYVTRKSPGSNPLDALFKSDKS